RLSSNAVFDGCHGRSAAARDAENSSKAGLESLRICFFFLLQASHFAPWGRKSFPQSSLKLAAIDECDRSKAADAAKQSSSLPRNVAVSPFVFIWYARSLMRNICGRYRP